MSVLSSKPVAYGWLIGCLLVVLICLYKAIFAFMPLGWWNGKLTATMPSRAKARHIRTKKIDNIRVGDRVAARGPVASEEEDELTAEVDSATWRRLEVRASKTDGSYAHVELLRPASWVSREQARVGETVRLDAPDCGISGLASVLAIGECPPIKPGKGRIVTGTFKHSATEVLDIYLEGEDKPLGVTPNHPFWSEDRQQFVRADKLGIGERLRGQWGTPRVSRVVSREGAEVVYNLEVHGTHIFHVTSLGILVHNATPRTGYIYEISYVKDGKTRFYVGQAGSGAQDVYERLWGTRAGVNSQGNAGRDLLKAYPDAKVRIWQVDLTGAPRGKGYLGTQEQHVKEAIARTYGSGALDNIEQARSMELGSAYKDSSKAKLPQAQQDNIRDEIRRLQAEGRKLPLGTPANRAIEEMTKYDLETLRYGDRLGKPVVDGPQVTAKQQARLLCGR
jgi:hypothetical protein